MLLDYVIIRLSEIRTTKGVLTYYIITEGGESLKCLCMIMGYGDGVDLVMTQANKFFLQISGFSLIYINLNNF